MLPRRPHVDHNSLHAIQEAIELLALLRGICPPITNPDHHPDPGDALHLAWSLALQIDAYLPELIDHARHHGHTWNQIRDLLTPTTTR